MRKLRASATAFCFREKQQCDRLAVCGRVEDSVTNYFAVRRLYCEPRLYPVEMDHASRFKKLPPNPMWCLMEILISVNKVLWCYVTLRAAQIILFLSIMSAVGLFQMAVREYHLLLLAVFIVEGKKRSLHRSPRFYAPHTYSRSIPGFGFNYFRQYEGMWDGQDMWHAWGRCDIHTDFLLERLK